MVMGEYFDQNHAELVPTADLEKPVHEVFYLPLQVVRKKSISTIPNCVLSLTHQPHPRPVSPTKIHYSLDLPFSPP